ncbi:hypothetical protein GGR58DRAFT_506472 [Xylaria digitata]|nr:hypothetical protein GGR58DRAFT_506472 [Xylaria digitata]
MSNSTCFPGLVTDREKSSRYGNRNPDRDPTVHQADVRVHMPPSFTQWSITQTHDYDNQTADRDNTTRHIRSPTVPKAERFNQKQHTSQLSSSGASSSSVIDFTNTRRSPRKYIHDRGGESGLSMSSSTTRCIMEDPMTQTGYDSGWTDGILDEVPYNGKQRHRLVASGVNDEEWVTCGLSHISL